MKQSVIDADSAKDNIATDAYTTEQVAKIAALIEAEASVVSTEDKLAQEAADGSELEELKKQYPEIYSEEFVKDVLGSEIDMDAEYPQTRFLLSIDGKPFISKADPIQ